MNNNYNYPLTVYFDASCRLCRSEMQNIKAHDDKNLLVLIDCSVSDFDDTVFMVPSINKSAMMNRLHVQDANGRWVIGVEAFEVIYRTVGMDIIATLWGGKFTRPLIEQLYPWVVKHRHILSRMGFATLLEKYAARQVEKRRQQCFQGRCEVDE